MKKIFGLFAVLAALLLGLNACQKEIEQVEKPAVTHTLKFVTEAPLTKTTADIDNVNKTVDYSWTKDDENRFEVYEINGVTYEKAKEVIGNLEENGKMTLLADFDGSAVTGASYIALFNTGVKAEQTATGTTYDQLSDVLISMPVQSSDIENEELQLQFKRETAFALMTAKGLTDGANIIGASITSDQILAAEYDIKEKAFKEEGATKTISISNNGGAVSAISNGDGNVFFASAPITDAHITVGVVTGDAEGKFVAAYEKKIADDRSISFENGNVRPFNIGMNKVTEQTLDLSKDETTTASTEELSWDRTFVSVVAAKAEASTQANNYYPGVDNRTSTRFYGNSTLTFTQKLNVPIKTIEFTATTENYATLLANSTWTNAQSSASGKTVTVTPINAFAAITATIGATCGFESIVITYGEPDPATPHSVIISETIENGEVSADPTSATIGTEITLTATPATGYEFGEWSVTNASTSELIAVEDNKFTMPDADVNVSATFKEEGREKVTTMSGTSDADIKFITGSSSAEKAVWANSSPLTANNITLSGSVTSGTNYSYYDGSVVRFYTNNNLVITPSDGATITKIEIVRQTTTSSNGGTINCTGLTASSDNTTTNTNVYTGEASSAVTFSVSAQARFTQIVVYSTLGKTVTDVTISGTPTKKSYKAGDSFETAGLSVTATFDDSSSEDVTDEVDWTVTPENLEAGTTSVSVVATYKSVESDPFEVSGLTVTEPATLTSISVNTAPNKVTYTEGDKFDPTGLVISRNYSDETSDDYSYAGHEDDFSFDPALATSLTEENDKITITYQGKSVDQAITVSVPTFSSLEDLVAADLTSGTVVKVTFENIPIKSIFVTKDGYRNGIYFDIQKGGKDIEIYYQNVPETWIVGGTVTGTMTCPWKVYNGTWELAPDYGEWNWDNLTYTASEVLSAPAIVTQPISANYDVNETADELEVAATGYPSPTYQWYSNTTNSNENGTELSGETNATYTPSTTTTGTFYYYCVATNSEGSAKSDVATITVKEPTAASLPFTFDGGSSDIESTDGMSQEGLGSDYKTTITKLKFDNTGDYVVINFNEAATKVTYTIKGNSFSDGTFDVMESADGVSYTNVKSHPSLEGSDVEFNHNLSSTSRYVKFVYTNKVSGNVGLGNIKISSESVKEYTLTINTATNGSISAKVGGTDVQSAQKIEAGKTVTLTATPASGYKFESWSVTNTSTSAAIQVTNNQFTMPTSDVTVSATFTEDTGGGQGGTTYTKVTSAPTDWSGIYILVYDGKACNAGVDAASNYTEVSDVNGTITGEYADCEVEIAKYSTGYSIKALGGTNKGKFLEGKGSSSNGTTFAASASKVTTLSISNNVVTITNNTNVFAYNSAANNLRWRFFKSATASGSGYYKPTLYKKN